MDEKVWMKGVCRSATYFVEASMRTDLFKQAKGKSHKDMKRKAENHKRRSKSKGKVKKEKTIQGHDARDNYHTSIANGRFDGT